MLCKPLRLGLTLLLTCATLLAAAPRVDRGTPAAVVRTFYTWYMQTDVSHPEGTKQFFTSALSADYLWVVGAERCTKSEIIDYDPFNGSQLQSTKFTVGPPAVRGTSASVPVKVRLWKNLSSQMTVHVVRAVDGWRISDFVDSHGNGLAKALTIGRADTLHYPKMTPSEKACLRALPR